MPTVTIEGYKFRWASDRSEPPHVHVVHSGRMAKIWIQSATVDTITATIRQN